MNLTPSIGPQSGPTPPPALHAPIVDGVPDHIAAMALSLLEEAPTLSPSELAEYLGITEHQARACRRSAGRGW